MGDVFPADCTIARFLTRLCVVTNDLILNLENSSREQQRKGRERQGVSLYYLYTSCSHFREAVKVLDEDLSTPEVKAFVAELDSAAHTHLQSLLSSFTPWQGSFVETRLKPLRDLTFHYLPRSDVEESLRQSSGLVTSIDLGTGTYADTRYAFADQVITTVAAVAFGRDEHQMEESLDTFAGHVRSYVFFTHKAVAHYLHKCPKSVFTIIERR